ncbi:MAG: hypothetical protein KAU29_02290 [Gammaproteobacteria bacterium]|nr:hypothetical protein [Gammaproteobacteria bacterium]
MKILYIFNDGPDEKATKLIEEQKNDNEIETVDLTNKETSYDELVDKIEQCDKVISWQG